MAGVRISKLRPLGREEMRALSNVVSPGSFALCIRSPEGKRRMRETRHEDVYLKPSFIGD